METRSFAPGETIFREGDVGDTAYLVASGTVEISRVQDGKAMVLGDIRPGSLFGEMALISDAPRSADAKAKDACTLYCVPRSVFQSELGGTSALMRSLVLNLINHVRSLMAQLEEAGKPVKPDVIVHQPIDFKSYRS